MLVFFCKLAKLEFEDSNTSAVCFSAMNFADIPDKVADISDSVFLEKKN